MSFEVASYPAAQAPAEARGAFIRRTYWHLALAILGFIGVEALLLSWPGAPGLVRLMTGGYGWLLTLGLFMLLSWLADTWTRSATSQTTQYLGLGLGVVAQAVIFLPLLYIAAFYSSPDLIPNAAMLTGLLFAGLTFTAFTSGVDFSFLRGALVIGGFVALGFIIASIVFGFTLGLLFSVVMVIFAGASILYQTSNILRTYHTDQHVAAALALFASVALLFWYILRILMSMRR
jgi:FtsH-binding integral membrane protein